MKNKIIFTLIILELLIHSCNNPDCRKIVEKVFRKQHYKLKIIGKYSYTRYYRIIGVNEFGKIDTTQEIAIESDLYERAKRGDSLFKDSGKLELYLKKKDSLIEFPCYCFGKRIE